MQAVELMRTTHFGHPQNMFTSTLSASIHIFGTNEEKRNPAYQTTARSLTKLTGTIIPINR